MLISLSTAQTAAGHSQCPAGFALEISEVLDAQRFADVAAPDRLDLCATGSLGLLPLQAEIALLRQFQMRFDKVGERHLVRGVVKVRIPQRARGRAGEVAHLIFLKEILASVSAFAQCPQ